MTGLRGIVSSNTTTNATLTEADIVKTWIALLERKPQPHRHIIASSARPGTWTVCSECRIPVLVPADWDQR